jgi:hypothetical protein
MVFERLRRNVLALSMKLIAGISAAICGMVPTAACNTSSQIAHRGDHRDHPRRVWCLKTLILHLQIDFEKTEALL